MTQKAAINGLYAITPDVADTSELVAMTQQALEGGASLIQYRNKAADGDLRLHQAHSLARLCQDFQVPFIINDHLDLAITLGADGVHLGGEDASLTEARRRLGAEKIVGISCYDQLDRAVEAEQHGADYVAFGAFFTSVTKPEATHAPLNLLARARQELRIPIIAIGGVTSDNAGELIRRGADAVAVSNALFCAHDIRLAAEKISRLIKQNKANRAFHSSSSSRANHNVT
jgi:thiamine-phosphate pyrophosphorylase